MRSSLVLKGWGTGGAISFRLMPCDDIPLPLRTTAYDCDTVDASTGRPVYDEALAWWLAYDEPAWLTRELAPLRAKLAVF